MRTKRKNYKYDSSDYDNGDYNEDDFDEEDDHEEEDHQEDSDQDSDYDDSQNGGKGGRKSGVNATKQKSTKTRKREEKYDDHDDSYEDEDPFSPEIDQILADKVVELQVSGLGPGASTPGQGQVLNQQNLNSKQASKNLPHTKKATMFLVKYAEQSYLHVRWVEETELEEYSQQAKPKIRRYYNAKEKKRLLAEYQSRQTVTIKPKKKHHFSDDEEEEEEEDEDAAIKGISVPDLPIIIEDIPDQEVPKPSHIPVFTPEGEDLTKYFDKNYAAVERVISTTLLFPVVHPRQAKQIRGKWQEDCIRVVNVLANYRKNNVALGLPFCEQLDAENEELARYFKVIKQPIDLVMIMNRLFNKSHQEPMEFWIELGLLFKNCRTYYKSTKKGLRKQCDALRCLALHLYNDWFNEMRQRFITGVALPPPPLPQASQPAQNLNIPKSEPPKPEKEGGNLIVNLSSLLNKNHSNQESKSAVRSAEQSVSTQNHQSLENPLQNIPTNQQQQQLQAAGQSFQNPAQSKGSNLSQFAPPQQMTPSSMQNTQGLQNQNQLMNSQQQMQMLQQQQMGQIQPQGFQSQNSFGMNSLQNQMPPPNQPNQQMLQQPPSLPSLQSLMSNQQIPGLNSLNQLGMNLGMNQGFGQGNQLMDQSQFAQNGVLPGVNQLLNPLGSQQQMRATNLINPQQQTQDFLQSQQQLEFQRLQQQLDPTGQLGLASLGQLQNQMHQNQLLSQMNPFQQQMGMLDPQLQALQQQMMGLQGGQLTQMNQLELMQLMNQQSQQEQMAMQFRQGMGMQPGQLPSLSQIQGLNQQSNQMGGGLQLPSLSQLGQFNQNFGGFNNPMGGNGFGDPFQQQQNLLSLMQNQNQNAMMNPMMQQPGMGGMMRMQQQFPSTMGSSNAYDEMSMMLQQSQLQGLGQPNFNQFNQQPNMGLSQNMHGQLQPMQMQHTRNQIPQMQQQPQFTRVHELNLIQPDQDNNNFNDRQQDPPVAPAIFDPGQYDLSWILEPGETAESVAVCAYLTEEDIAQAVGSKNYVDQLYLVKWRGLSYTQSTWEPESLLKPIYEEKLSDYRLFNRGLDQNQREKLDSLIKNHKKMLRFTEKKHQQGKRMDENQQNVMALQEAKLNRQLLNQKIQEIMGNSFYQVVQYSEKDGLVPQFKKPHLKLKDYQIIGLNWLIRAWHQHRNVVLADEMGLGKTIMTLSLFEHFNRVYRLKGPYLILAPLTTLEHWKRIAEEWTTLNSVLYYDPGSSEGRSELRYWEWFYTDITYKGQVTTKSELFKFNIIITSFEVFMQDLHPIVQEIPFLYIVVDEAHRLKNKQAKTLKLLKDHPCKRILLLTGTPVQNNTKELWTLLNYIEPDKFNSMEDFMENYGNLENFEQIQKLHTILKPHFLRRLKEEVDNSIPPLQETVIEVGLTTVQTTYYKGIYGENRMMLAKFGTNSIKTSQLNNIDVQLRKCCNHLFLLKGVEEELTQDCKNEQDLYKKLLESSGKLMLLDKFIEKFKKENHKMLIFSQFKRMLDIIELYLKMKAVPYEKLTGSVKTQDRISAIQRFNDDKTFGVFLLTTRAGGLGINLTSARVVIIFDSDWNPQNDLQAIARAHRIGQKFEVQVFRLITSKTYEEQMFERASKKLGMEQALFSKGAFHQNEDEFSQLHLRGFTELKQDSKEIENLLRFGAYAFMDEREGDEEQNYNKDIDEILATGKKKEFKYDKGIYTLQKSTFNAAKYENLPDVEDPEFWNKILPLNSIMSIGMLEKRFKKEKKEMTKSEKMQKEFFKDLEVVFNDFMDAKFDTKTSQQSKKQFEADEEKLREILNKMVKLTGMRLLYVDKCKEWMREMIRTNKRKKPLQTMFQDDNQPKDEPGEEEEDAEMQVDENDIIVYESDENYKNNRTLRKRNPVPQQPPLETDEKLPKKRGRKPKNFNPPKRDQDESEGANEEEEDYGEEDEKEFNERPGRRGTKDEDYGESDDGGYGLRNSRKRQKTGKEQEGLHTSNHLSREHKSQPKINEQIIKRNEKNGIVCAYCMQPATQEKMCAYFCQDYCSRFFHEECKELMFPSGDESKRRLRTQLQHNSGSGSFWKCDDCLESKATCFCCKLKGQILLFPKKGKPKAAGGAEGLFLSGAAVNEEDEDQEAEDIQPELVLSQSRPEEVKETAQINENTSNQDERVQDLEMKEDPQVIADNQAELQQLESRESQDINPTEQNDSEKQVVQIEGIDEQQDQEADGKHASKDHTPKAKDQSQPALQESSPVQIQEIIVTSSPKKTNTPTEEAKLMRVQGSPEPEPNDKKYVVRCTLGGCFRYYHVDCVYQNKNVSCINSMKVQRFRCPLHYCEICQASGDSVLIVQCVNCPTAYHLKCLPSDSKAIRLTKKYIICGKHELSPESFPKYEEKSNGYVSVKNIATSSNQVIGFASFTQNGLSASQDQGKKPKKRGRKPKNPILFEQNEESDGEAQLAKSLALIKQEPKEVLQKIEQEGDQDQAQDNDQDQEMMDMMQSISQQQLSNTHAQIMFNSVQQATSQSSGSLAKIDSKREPLHIPNNPSYPSVQRSSNEERLMQSNSSARLHRQDSSSEELRNELGNQSSRQQQMKPLFAVEKGQSRSNQSLQ